MVTSDEFDADAVHYGRAFSRGGVPTSVPVRYETGTLALQLGVDETVLRVRTLSPNPCDLSDPLWDLDLELDDDSCRMLQALDERNLAEGVRRSVEWFGAPLTRDGVRQLYTPLVRKDRRTSVATVQVDLGGEDPTQIWSGHVDEANGALVADASDRKVILRGAPCRTLVETSGLWFVGGREFGMHLKASSVLILAEENARRSTQWEALCARCAACLR